MACKVGVMPWLQKGVTCYYAQIGIPENRAIKVFCR